MHWLKDAPPWLSTLASRDVDDTGLVSLRWLSESDAAKEKSARADAWQHGGFSGAFVEAGAARIARMTPVAVGPERKGRSMLHTSRATLWLDGDALFAAFDDATPPALFVPAGTSRASIDAAFAPYLATTNASRSAAVARGFMGTERELGTDREGIENHVVMAEPWLDRASWGSAYDDDPWPDAHEPKNMLVEIAVLREHMRQDPQRVPSTSWRSMWSKSVVTIETHPFGALVAEVHYVSSTHTDVITALNATLGMRLPIDLPVDAAASLLFAGFNEERFLLENDPYSVMALCATAPLESRTFDALRARADDDACKTAVLQMCDAYRYDALLLERLACESDPALRAQLASLLAPDDGSPRVDDDEMEDA